MYPGHLSVSSNNNYKAARIGDTGDEMEKFDAIIKYLNLAWGVIVVVALVVFFAAGEWGKWVNIRDNWEKITKIEGIKEIESGMILLSQEECEGSNYKDITNSFDGLYLYADKDVSGVPTKNEESSAHTHDGGPHQHYVTGKTDKLDSARRASGGTQVYVGKKLRIDVTGTAMKNKNNIDSSHEHGGGDHEHRRVGFRLCRFK